MSGEPSLPVDSVPLSPRKELSKSLVTLRVSNEISGMQTTKVFKPGSLTWVRARGSKEGLMKMNHR